MKKFPLLFLSLISSFASAGELPDGYILTAKSITFTINNKTSDPVKVFLHPRRFSVENAQLQHSEHITIAEIPGVLKNENKLHHTNGKVFFEKSAAIENRFFLCIDFYELHGLDCVNISASETNNGKIEFIQRSSDSASGPLLAGFITYDLKQAYVKEITAGEFGKYSHILMRLNSISTGIKDNRQLRLYVMDAAHNNFGSIGEWNLKGSDGAFEKGRINLPAYDVETGTIPNINRYLILPHRNEYLLKLNSMEMADQGYFIGDPYSISKGQFSMNLPPDTSLTYLQASFKEHEVLKPRKDEEDTVRNDFNTRVNLSFFGIVECGLESPYQQPTCP